MDFEYIVLDYFNSDIYSYIKNAIKTNKKNISIITKISDLCTLKNLHEIYENSEAVILALNYFCKELSYIDVKHKYFN
jgi:pyruvate kinase